MRILWRVRRFFCDNHDCIRTVFAEQIPELANRHAQSTPRFNRTLVHIGLESGGEPGARLSRKMGIPTSGATILRRLRSLIVNAEAQASVAIGIDDFAFRKGTTYGTIIVDHESGRPIDLLDQRDSSVVQQWLTAHSQAQWVTRDRAGCYGSAVSTALPNATQIADRWHLLANARTALVNTLGRFQSQIRAIAEQLVQPDVVVAPLPVVELLQATTLTKQEQLSHDNRLRRLARCKQVLELHSEGKSQRAISRILRMSEETVAKRLRAGCFVERAKPVTH